MNADFLGPRGQAQKQKNDDGVFVEIETDDINDKPNENQKGQGIVRDR